MLITAYDTNSKLKTFFYNRILTIHRTYLLWPKAILIESALSIRSYNSPFSILHSPLMGLPLSTFHLLKSKKIQIPKDDLHSPQHGYQNPHREVWAKGHVLFPALADKLDDTYNTAQHQADKGRQQGAGPAEEKSSDCHELDISAAKAAGNDQ